MIIFICCLTAYTIVGVFIAGCLYDKNDEEAKWLALGVMWVLWLPIYIIFGIIIWFFLKPIFSLGKRFSGEKAEEPKRIHIEDVNLHVEAEKEVEAFLEDEKKS